MLNWAILGTGFISHKMIEAIKASDASRVHVIAGRNADRMAAFRAQHDIPYAAGYQDALAMTEVDAVYIGAPNHVHHSLTLAAAKAGKPVLSEKSLATTMEDAHALAGAVRDHGIFFVEGFMYLAHPMYTCVLDILRDGRLGRLRAINGTYSADIWDVTNPLGKGTLYNLGCYPVSLTHLVVQVMCGDGAFADRRVAGHGAVSPKDGTIVDASVSVKFADGVLVTLQSADSYGMAHSFQIAGDKGVLRFVTNPWLPLAGRNHLQWCPYDGDIEDIYVDDDHDAFYHQVKMVEQAVAGGAREATRPSPRLSDSIEIMEFLTDWEAQCLLT